MADYLLQVAYNFVSEVRDSLYRQRCYDRCLLESTWAWAKGMMTMIGCAEVVSVSISCSRCYNLT